MIVHAVALEPPVINRPTLAYMATVETDRGTFVFAAMISTRVTVACYRFNGMFRHAFELTPEDTLVCHDAIRQAVEEKERARTAQGGAA